MVLDAVNSYIADAFHFGLFQIRFVTWYQTIVVGYK
jgi:hypothetical protein